MKKPEANTDFESKAKQWDQNPVPVRIAQGVGEAILRELDLRPDMEVLDFGCGTGLVTLWLQPRVGTITGADSSQGMIGILQEKIKHLGVTNVRTQLVDFEKGGRVAGTFDLVVSSMTLHHVADTEALIRHWHGLLRPDGRLCFADLDTEDGSFHSDNTGVHHKGFDRKKLRELLGKTGFREVSDMTATSVVREGEGRVKREYPVFLIIGKKE